MIQQPASQDAQLHAELQLSNAILRAALVREVQKDQAIAQKDALLAQIPGLQKVFREARAELAEAKRRIADLEAKVAELEGGAPPQPPTSDAEDRVDATH